MKYLVGVGYGSKPLFTPSAKTLTFVEGNPVRNLDEDTFLLIINNTTNEVIFDAKEPGLGLTSWSNGVLTLEYDTTSMEETDSLQVWIEGPSAYRGTCDLSELSCAHGS